MNVTIATIWHWPSMVGIVMVTVDQSEQCQANMGWDTHTHTQTPFCDCREPPFLEKFYTANPEMILVCSKATRPSAESVDRSAGAACTHYRHWSPFPADSFAQKRPITKDLLPCLTISTPAQGSKVSLSMSAK